MFLFIIFYIQRPAIHPFHPFAEIHVDDVVRPVSEPMPLVVVPPSPSPSLGVELEMVVARRSDGASYPVADFFSHLHVDRQARGEAVSLERAYNGQPVAVVGHRGNTSVDNGFNNLESALGPLGTPDQPGGLETLHGWIREEVDDVLHTLAQEDAVLLNFSEHPAMAIDEQTYQRIRAPKPIYDYWVNVRGWNHSAGIDAKAQNGPTTGVPLAKAVQALNLILATSPAFIALFANSPFENSQITAHKENRLTLWPRMFSTAHFWADDQLHRLPGRPFAHLRDYFEWMFGSDRRMQPVPCDTGSDYKGASNIARVEGDPALLDYLRQAEWPAQHLHCSERLMVRPVLDHLVFQQYAHFLDARIRYGLRQTPPLEHFWAAWHHPEQLEALFDVHLAYCYIEGRSPGANFPDREIMASGDVIGASVVIAPSALQFGLLRNLEQASRWMARWPWEMLPALRQAAVQEGLQGRVGTFTVHAFCDQVLELAGAGLDRADAWMLAYPEQVLRQGCNGADRALAAYSRLPGSQAAKMQALIQARQALPVPRPPISHR